MSRELEFRPGECDSCRWFLADHPRPHRGPKRVAHWPDIEDVGRCGLEGGPVNARTTRGTVVMTVLAESRLVSSGMTCDKFEQGEISGPRVDGRRIVLIVEPDQVECRHRSWRHSPCGMPAQYFVRWQVKLRSGHTGWCSRPVCYTHAAAWADNYNLELPEVA